jgi:hypothetical protein
MGLGGQDLCQLLQGARGSHGRSHLDPVTEEHDIYQRDQLPEEVHAGKAKDYRRAVDVGHGYGYCHQGHHARLPFSKFGFQADKEGIAAIEVDCGGEQEKEGTGAGRLPMKAEELLHVRREQEYWPGKDEREDEPPLEIGQHALMALACMALPSMAGVSHLRLILLGSIRQEILSSPHFPVLLGLFLFDSCCGLLIRGLMMRVG